MIWMAEPKLVETIALIGEILEICARRPDLHDLHKTASTTLLTE